MVCVTTLNTKQLPNYLDFLSLCFETSVGSYEGDDP